MSTIQKMLDFPRELQSLEQVFIMTQNSSDSFDFAPFKVASHKQLFEVPKNIFHLSVVPIRRKISVMSLNYRKINFYSFWLRFVKDQWICFFLVNLSGDNLQVKVYARCTLNCAPNCHKPNMKSNPLTRHQIVLKTNF